jgi:hypothetical protein
MRGRACGMCSVGLLCIAIGRLAVAVGGFGWGIRGSCGIGLNVGKDAAQEGREIGHFAGTEEREGVSLNGGGPVGGVGVESME